MFSFLQFRGLDEVKTSHYNLSLFESKDSRPKRISKNNLKSDSRLHKGYLKVAGLFFSKK